MLGDSVQIEKDIAKKLALTYRNKVLSEAKLILASYDSYEAESLEHWNKVMEVLMDGGLDDDRELNECKRQLLARRDLQSIGNLSPAELDTIEKELRTALDSLSAHKSRLSNIKLSIRK
jgi:hypothetical protein